MRIICLEKAGEYLNGVVNFVLDTKCAIFGHKWKLVREDENDPRSRTIHVCTVCGKIDA